MNVYSGLNAMKTMAVRVLIGFWIVFLVWLAGFTVGAAANADVLVWASIPLTLIPIAGLYFLPANAERAGWALFTVWLGSTYAALGTPLELGVFGLICVFAILGYFRSSWLFVISWFGHIAWDFVPRSLPDLYLDLPAACMLFDGAIGLYLAWRIRRGTLSVRPIGFAL
jgi:hypothetical protein